MKIVALDIATQTGIAIGSPGGEPVSYSVDLGKAPDDKRFARILGLTWKLIEEQEPDLIAIEAAIGGPKASQYLVGLVACVRGCAANRGVPTELYYLASIRKHFVGKNLTVKDYPGLSVGKAKQAIKQTVVDRCRMLGWNPVDDNAADACALLDYALALNTKHQARVAGGLL